VKGAAGKGRVQGVGEAILLAGRILDFPLTRSRRLEA
jgi:hypothetical protein